MAFRQSKWKATNQPASYCTKKVTSSHSLAGVYVLQEGIGMKLARITEELPQHEVMIWYHSELHRFPSLTSLQEPQDSFPSGPLLKGIENGHSQGSCRKLKEILLWQFVHKTKPCSVRREYSYLM